MKKTLSTRQLLALLLLTSIVFNACSSYEHFTKRRYNKGFYVSHSHKPIQHISLEQEFAAPLVKNQSPTIQLLKHALEKPKQTNKTIDIAIKSNSECLAKNEVPKKIALSFPVRKRKQVSPYERIPDDGLIDISKKPRTLAIVMGACFITTGLGLILCIPLLIMAKKRQRIFKENPQMYKNGEELDLYVTVGWIGVILLMLLTILVTGLLILSGIFI